MKYKITIRTHLTLFFGIISLFITTIIGISLNISVDRNFEKYSVTKNQQQMNLLISSLNEDNKTLFSESNKVLRNSNNSNNSNRIYQLNSMEQELKDSINRSILIIGFISLIFSLLLGYIISKKLAKPIIDLTDITQKIENGNYLIKLKNNSNIYEVNQLGLSLEKMGEKINDSFEHDKRVSQDIQHEIRTPLTNIKAQIEAMLDGVWEINKENLSLCLNEIERLNSIINQLYKLGNIENNLEKLVFSEFDLRNLISFIIKEYDLSLSEKSMTITNEIDENIKLISDENLIKSAISNLISNSIRYSGENTKIKIAYNIFVNNDEESIFYDVIKEKGNINNSYSIISVEDNGVGISKENLEYIFERFFRVDKSRSRKIGGAGIGLSIVNAIAYALNGFVVVESEENVKTIFYLFIEKNNY